MARKHVKATSSDSARKKGASPGRVVSKVNYIKGSKEGKMKTYDLTTREREK